MKSKVLWLLILILTAGLIIEGVLLFSTQKKLEALSYPRGKNRQARLPHYLTKEKAILESFEDWHWDDLFSPDWELQRSMQRLKRQIQKVFNDSFIKGMESQRRGDFFLDGFFEPDIDIQEDKTHYTIKIDLPGLEKDKIKLEVSNKVLTISGERESSFKQDGTRYFRQERSWGHFLRRIPLPEDAREDDIIADYRNGVLTIKIAKASNGKQPEESSKRITIF